MKKHSTAIFPSAPIIIIVSVMSFAFIACKDKRKSELQPSNYQKEVNQRKDFLIKQLLKRKCERLKNPRHPQHFDYLEDVDINLRLTYRIRGYHRCDGTFTVQLPPEPDDPDRDRSLENYNFTEIVVLDSNSNRVTEVFLRRDTLLMGQDLKWRQFLQVLDFQYEEYVSDKEAFLFTYFIVNPAEAYRENYIHLYMKRNGSFSIEDMGSLAAR